MTAIHHGKEIHLDGTPIADARSESHAATIVDALRTSPVIDFELAQQIGGELCDRWEDMTGGTPLDRGNMAWGDIVQFVMRKARVFEDGGGN